MHADSKNLTGNRASKASPILGCSIEILRDIYVCMSVCQFVKPIQKICAKMRGRNYVA